MEQMLSFYEIQNCYQDVVENRPVLIAPVETPLSLLSRYQFTQLADGRWCHFLTIPEQESMRMGVPFPYGSAYMQPNTYAVSVSGQEDMEECRNKAIAGFIGLAVGFFIPGLSLAGQIVAFIMMLNLRKDFPHYKPGKVLMGLMIAESVLLLIGIILFLIFLGILLPLLENAPQYVSPVI